MDHPWNVLLVTVDQWRADALGCAGNPVIRTPHLDALARDGTRFANHYANASPCAPSRAALLTGMYQHNNGVVRNGSPLDARFTNVALEARNAGYDPVLFGYTDTAVDPRTVRPGDPALRTYESVLPGFTPELHLPEPPLPWLAHLARQGYDFGTDIEAVYAPAATTAGRSPTSAPARFRAEDSITAFLTDRLLDYICAAKRTGNSISATPGLRRPKKLWASPWTPAVSPSSAMRAASTCISRACRHCSSTFVPTPGAWTTGHAIRATRCGCSGTPSAC